tara:strand:+ start:806 stop:1039 length:234 start_codon:yes stop_codon:yes gene_type:complete
MAKSMMDEDCMDGGDDEKAKCKAPKVSSNKKTISKPKAKKGNPMNFQKSKYNIPNKPKSPPEPQDSTWGSHQNVRYL